MAVAVAWLELVAGAEPAAEAAVSDAQVQAPLQVFVKQGDPGEEVAYLLSGDFPFPGGLRRGGLFLPFYQVSQHTDVFFYLIFLFVQSLLFLFLFS